MYGQIRRNIQRNDIDSILVRFGESLKCPQKYYVAGKQQAQKVFRTLKRQSSFSLASFRIGGSFGKKTDVIEPDLDLVVLVNDYDPPLDDVLEDFEYVLRCNENTLNIRHNEYKKSERSLTFYFKNGISVDLLPAANVEEHEIPNVLEQMGKSEKYAYFYCPSFVQDQISFMKSQDSFTHSLVRLSKFWLKSLHLGESFRGGSAMIELIAVAAAEKARQLDNKSASQAFMRVVNTVGTLRRTRLAFEKENYDYEQNQYVWKRVPAVELICDNCDRLVPTIVGKKEILKRDCFIIDPANPFQDYLEDKTDSVFEILENFARVTCNRLERILSGNEKYGQWILELFEPMPEEVIDLDKYSICPPTNVLISYDVSCKQVYNKLKIWNKNRMWSDEVRRTVKLLKNKLLTVVHSAVKGDPENVTVEDVGSVVWNLMGKSLKSVVIEDALHIAQHRRYDVMLRVPYIIDRVGYAVCLSMTWNPGFSDYQFERSVSRFLPRCQAIMKGGFRNPITLHLHNLLRRLKVDLDLLKLWLQFSVLQLSYYEILNMIADPEHVQYDFTCLDIILLVSFIFLNLD